MEMTLTNIKILLGGSLAVSKILTDDELQTFLDDEINVYKAASKAAFAITAYFTHKASNSIDVISIQHTARANAFRELAKELNILGDNYSGNASGEFVYVDPDTDEKNDEPVFSMDMFEYKKVH